MFKVGNSKLIHQDLAYFNEHYKIKKCMTKAANGVLFHGIRNSDESKVILKIVPKEKCHRFGVMRDADREYWQILIDEGYEQGITPQRYKFIGIYNYKATGA